MKGSIFNFFLVPDIESWIEGIEEEIKKRFNIKILTMRLFLSVVTVADGQRFTTLIQIDVLNQFKVVNNLFS